ncbi:MAG: hypothetical protein E7313_08265 [Clostridiales bacterium]|nr:hypothetical protein [Clostridiales bacterium]
MRKKSLYDIAMEQKNDNSIDDEKVIIIRKNNIVSLLIDILGKCIKFILYIILFILLTIGATVLINSQIREVVLNILKQTI